MAEEQIAGRNPVLEALRAGRPIHRLFVARGAAEGSIRQIRALARERGVPVHEVDRSRLDALAGPVRHQGVVAVVAGREYASLEEVLDRARAAGEDPLVLVLDGIEDPQNLGSLLRTCEGAGAHGVVIPERRAAGLTPAAVRVAAGAAEYVPVARVKNVRMALEELKTAGLWVCGATAEAPVVYHQAKLTGPLALVIGGENRGLSRVVQETCDYTVRIPMRGRLSSLNAAVAGAILLYEVRRQRDLLGP